MSDLLPDNTRRFPAVEMVYPDATLAPYIVRPLFFIFTVLLVIGAIGQLGGRILVANLEKLEPRINTLLAERGIELAGLEGDWRFFNPVLKVSSGEAPGVQFGAAWAEIDMLESLARNRVILRKAGVEELRVALVQDESGVWTLEGRELAPNSFDWQSLVWHSDQLELQALIGLRGFELPASELRIGGRVSNFGGRHRGEVFVADALACPPDALVRTGPSPGSSKVSAASAAATDCAIRARFNVEEAALWFRNRSGGALLSTKNFTVADSAAAFLGMDFLQLGELDARLRLLDERFSGPVRLLDTSAQLRGGQPFTLSVLADGWSEDDGSQANFALEAVQIGNTTNVLELREALVNWTNESGAVLRVPRVVVDDVTAVASTILAPDIPTAAWIKRLGMTGAFTRLLASWSADAGLGFSGDFDNVAIQSFRGVPSVAGLAGSFSGGTGYLQLRMLDAPATVGFPELYRETKSYDSITGQILMYFGQDYFGLTGSNLRFSEAGTTTSGGFSLVSTKPLTNNQLTLSLHSDAGEFADITPYVPYKLPQNVLDWLAGSAMEANLTAPRFVMHGPLREEESDMQRSYLIEAEMRDATMVFNSEWPRITQANGRVRVAHTGITADLSSARLADLDLQDMKVRMPTGSANVIAQGTTIFDASKGLEFIRTTPLKTSMDFVADDWWAEGQMRLNVDLDLPLEGTTAGQLDPRIRVAVTGRLENTTFGIPEARLVFEKLRGPLRYNYPYDVSGKNLVGLLFGRRMQLGVSNEPVAAAPPGQPERFAPRRIDFSMTGDIHSEDMWPLLNMTPSKVVDGPFEFAAVYSTETDTGEVPMLEVRTGFVGASVNLPEPFGKTPAQTSATEVSVIFGEERTRANLMYRGLLNADLGIADEGIVGGHMRLFGTEAKAAVTEPRTFASWDGIAGAIKIDGALDFADVAQWSADSSSGDGVELPPYQINDLRIHEAVVGEFAVPDVLLSGTSDEQQLQLAFSSATSTGELLVPEDGMTELHLSEFIYSDEAPASQEPLAVMLDASGSSAADEAEPTKQLLPTPDPLSPELMSSLQDMRVRIDALTVDGEDYGSWRFDILREADNVAFKSLVANVKNIEVTSEEGVLWSAADNRTSFAGALTAEDMGDVLEAWGYARSLESSSMLTNADVSWPGSPLNFEPLLIDGDVAVGVKDGRFLDVTSGNNALRIFSLLNFTAIAKRMSLNFKDVFGRGISFEKVEAATRLNAGLLTFTQPMRVEGTGGDFKINGTINLVSGELNNEMVVTLPVNKSLPWLGAYLALANPVVGIGVLVGERILRKPIKGLSSAKYSVTGPVDDPKLELVSVFDRSMDEGVGGAEEGAEEDETEEDETEEDGPITLPAAESSSAIPEPILRDPNQEEIAPDGSIETSPGS